MLSETDKLRLVHDKTTAAVHCPPTGERRRTCTRARSGTVITKALFTRTRGPQSVGRTAASVAVVLGSRAALNRSPLKLVSTFVFLRHDLYIAIIMMIIPTTTNNNNNK